MDHCNGLPTSTKVEAPIDKYENGSETMRDSPKSNASLIGTMLYVASKTRPYISFAVHQCDRFTHNTKVYNEKYVKRTCWYIQGNKDKGLVFNPSK